LEEIEKLRQRRKQRELQSEEMDRIKREESRMKELENFDEWAKKEEDFHLQQQRQRSAIRLVQGRDKPIDVLAKNMLMFEHLATVKLNGQCSRNVMTAYYGPCSCSFVSSKQSTLSHSVPTVT
jgi:hypothetical protein